MLRDLIWPRGRRGTRKPALRLEALEDRTTPAVPANDLFAATLYEGLLGRSIDSVGLNYWVPRLGIGNSTIAHQGVASGIATSNEAFSRDVQILYQTYLFRAPEAGGLAFWFAQLKAGASLNQVRAGILGSTEFFQQTGSNNSQFLDAVYQFVLGRGIEPAGQAFWTQKLNQTVSRTAVVQQILASPEANSVKVANFYRDILGREPDAGAGFWTQQLNAGASEFNVMAGFLASDEYVNDVQTYAAATPFTSVRFVAQRFISGGNLFTGPLPNAEELAGNLATSAASIFAANDSYSATLNTALSVTSPGQGVLGNDVDLNGLPLRVTSPGTFVTALGSVVLRSDGTFTYTPRAGATGTDAFFYTASDAVSTSNFATVTITIPNPSPVAKNVAYAVTLNTPLTVSSPSQGILANDSDPDGEPIQVTSAGTFTTAKATVQLNADGTFVYTPNTNATGLDTFTYTVSDANGVSNTATVFFTISPGVGGGDAFEPNETSDQATNFGAITTAAPFMLAGLSITNTSRGLPDYDWYRWTAAAAGTFSATLTTTSGGPLELHLFTLKNNVLSELSSTTSGTLSTPVTAGQVMLVEVKGANTAPGVFSTGTYNLDVTLT
jgi:hypothetical protein